MLLIECSYHFSSVNSSKTKNLTFGAGSGVCGVFFVKPSIPSSSLKLGFERGASRTGWLSNSSRVGCGGFIGSGDSNGEFIGSGDFISSGDSAGEWTGDELDLTDLVGDLTSPAAERRGSRGGRGDLWLVFDFGTWG